MRDKRCGYEGSCITGTAACGLYEGAVLLSYRVGEVYCRR